MSRRKINAGSTSNMLPIFVQDTSSTLGAGLASLVYNTSGLTARYRRVGSAIWTTITLVTATVGTYASGGFIVDTGSAVGLYEFHPPDAACAAGVAWVVFQIYGATNMLPVVIEVELDAVNYQSNTSFVASVPSVVGSVGSVTGAVGSVTGNVGGDVTGKVLGGGASSFTAVGVQSDLQTIKTQTVTCSAGVTINAIVGNATHAIVVDSSGSVTFNNTSLSGSVGSVTGAVGSVTSAVTLSAGDSPVLQSGTAAAGAASTITIASAIGADSRPVGCTIKITSGTGSGQARIITGYVDATKVVTVDRTWATNPDNTSVYSILYTELPAENSSLQPTSASVQGNVTGSVGSVTGSVGSVTGAVGSISGISFPTNFSAIAITAGGIVQSDLQTIKTQSVTCAAGVTINAIVGNATHAIVVDGSGYITFNNTTLSGSVGSVTGTVGSVTGNVGGNVSGNVSGSVGSVTGSVGSVAGNVGGSVVGDVQGKVLGGGSSSITGDGVQSASVTGSVGSVAGAVGSVTGNVSGDVAGKVLGGGSSSISGAGVRADQVTGSVGSVTGAVGSVTGLTPGNLDVTVSSRLASVSYISPDNADVQTLLALLQADIYIDTTTTPWHIVWMQAGSGAIGIGIELMRKHLHDVTGANIVNTTTVIGQAQQIAGTGS